MRELYINGKQASLWQKILITLGSIGFLLLIIPLGLGILAVGAVLAVIFYVYLYFKVRKIKKVMQAAQAAQAQHMYENMRPKAEPTKRNIIDGEYKEL
ncbi:hypothetical protein [Wohlfahrtiimonas chitiniclastica]|uniref:hypothetical protein n=1 Tax=Wohlfahrtiimonas chitiniclastica TaxID=400946 RepID=UPI0007B69680|nr:hypothetical protein [Wohlfahrtiimonas chitiniclastica]KZX37657.1 hypothetical protein A6V30_01895 [Wohlfahrtiimonas chitiniclastica]